MLLNSVVIVFREVLEAALLISVLLASHRFLKSGRQWVASALIAGILAAVVYGYFIGPVSDLFDGVGQEVCNALLQFGIYACLALVIFQFSRQKGDRGVASGTILKLMVVVVVLAIAREGSEIFVYVSGFWSSRDLFSPVAIGSVVGVCIGVSLGILIYYLLLAQNVRHAPTTTIVLLTLVAAGMASQATRLLVQADWITASAALWDTSNILSEQSLLGQLAYALVGYEASPAGIEVAAYLGSLFILIMAFVAGRLWTPDAEEATL